MKIWITLLLTSFSTLVFAQTPSANNEKAVIIKEYIELHKITHVEVQFRKGIFTSREFYSKWSFPGGNLIMLDGRAYNLDYIKYFELYVYNPGFKSEKRTIILKLDKIR
jgi:hypothetical protein